MIKYPRGIFWLLWAALTVVMLSAATFGDEVRLARPEYRGERANAPVPPSMHTRNVNPLKPMWGGCAPSSARTAALYHGVPRGQVDHFWRLAQDRVGIGGTNPQMLHAMLRESMPREKYFEYFGGDADRVLNSLSAKGRLICSWMNTGAQYGYRPIAHWVNVAHYKSGGMACFVDNNDVGFYHWLPAREMANRAMAAPGQTWIFCFTRGASGTSALIAFAIPLSLVSAGLGLLMVGGGCCYHARSGPLTEI